MSGPRPPRAERSSPHGGFTISELVVVLAVFAALITITVVSLNGIGDESDARDCRTELRTIKAATEQFKAQAGFYPPDDEALELAEVIDRADTPNWKVVTTDEARGPEYLPQGDRCA